MNKEEMISEEQLLHNKLSFEINTELIHLMKRIVELQEKDEWREDKNWQKDEIINDLQQENKQLKDKLKEIKEEYKRFKEADFIDINLITFIEKVGEIIGE